MAFIAYVEPDDIPPADRLQDRDNILRIHGVHARVMRLHYDLYLELARGLGPLSRVQREMIAVAVSAINGCHYCVEHHGAWLRARLRRKGVKDDEADALVAAVARDHRSAQLAPADRVMLDYAVKLTQAPSEIEPADVESLRSAGFDDPAIHDVCAIAAYYAFVNRIAVGLGVELEPRFHH